MKMKKRTDELFKILEKQDSFRAYEAEYSGEFSDRPLNEMLSDMLKSSGMTKSAVIEKANIDRVYGYQIFSGEKKNPSRDKLIMLCIAMGCTVSNVQELMKKCSYPMLYPRIRRDSALIFSLEQKLSVIETNELLFDLGMEILE